MKISGLKLMSGIASLNIVRYVLVLSSAKASFPWLIEWRAMAKASL
jgi:hypothetical protein